MGKLAQPILICTAIVIACVPAEATQIKTASGVVEGTSMGENEYEIFLDTSKGVQNIPKSSILEMDGKHFTYITPTQPRAQRVRSRYGFWKSNWVKVRDWCLLTARKVRTGQFRDPSGMEMLEQVRNDNSMSLAEKKATLKKAILKLRKEKGY